VVFRESTGSGQGQGRAGSHYEPLGAAGQVDKTTLTNQLFQQVLKLYRAQDWDLAEMQLLNLQQSSPECALYRCTSSA